MEVSFKSYFRSIFRDFLLFEFRGWFLTTDQLADFNTLQGTKMSHLKGTPPKTNHGYPKKGRYISIGNTSSNHWFSGDIRLLSRGYAIVSSQQVGDSSSHKMFVVGLLQISLAYSWPSAGQMEPEKILTRGTEPALSWGYLAWKLKKFGNTITSNIQKKKPNIQEWKCPIPTSIFFYQNIPSRELTYPTWGKGKSSSKVPFYGICQFPGGYPILFQVVQLLEPLFCQTTPTQGRLRHQRLILESRSCGFHCGERPMAKRILPNAGGATGSMRKYHLRLQVRNIHMKEFPIL